jgi:thiol-activated cytolysin
MSRALLLSLSLCVACSTGPGPGGGPGGGPEPGSAAAALNAAVESIDELPVGAAERVVGDPSAPMAEGDYSCARRDVHETRLYEELAAFDPNSESLWPGAIIQGEALGNGQLAQIVAPRAPATFSVSLENLAGARSATLPQPTLSAFREEIGKLLAAGVTGATPARIYAEIEKVDSQKQLELALGVKADVGVAANVAGSFNFSRTDMKSRYVVKFTQAYYTVDLDTPQSAAALFAPGTKPEDLGDALRPGNPPLYVSSVTFGRMVLFTFESQLSGRELGAALDVVYKAGPQVSGNTSLTDREVLDRTSIRALVLGGSGAEAVKSLRGFDALMQFIEQGGNYSKDSPGVPIAYKLAYLKNNRPARLSFTRDYQIEDCARVNQKVQVTLRNIKVVSAGGDAGNDLELFGILGAAAKNDAEIWSKLVTEHVTIAQGASFPMTGTLGLGIIDVEPGAGKKLSLYSSLHEYDPVGGNDLIGNEVVEVPFESGWRRSVVVRSTGSNAVVEVTFDLSPI